MISGPGCYTISAFEYHQDPCETPSLSASVANILLSQSPLHAKSAHPRLTDQPTQEESEAMDIGTICHALMLEGVDMAVVIPADNYRTKAAQEARDAARLAGKCPILERRMAEVRQMMVACRDQLDAHKDAFDAFTNVGKPEQTLVWQESNGIWCRCRIDWLRSDKPVIYDYKTGKRSARPSDVSRIAAANGWCIQAAFYMRGFRKVFGKPEPKPYQSPTYDLDGIETRYDRDITPIFRFVAQENFPPFALSVLELSPADLALAEAQVGTAIEVWGQCMTSGIWPGYSDRVQRITSPAYIESAWLERELEET